MSYLDDLRRRINRDDGKLFQVGNRPIGWAEGTGNLLFIGGIFLWQLHREAGVSGIWAISAASLGVLLCILGNVRK
ncbi:hypothetical protein L2Y96_00095 [Luteibacter aegosomaticola]|uniref:hypothetical protein n=1 Tax=Luteibacter aegosomaticola TaxID=2911538 RepID=UPI001FF863D1|nr:hypothetical protein [Luteibacter aegosomaticola]UPG90206.1 hypothetical protein L2Y96_00095 [Luteibacter aegosomaticola]